MRISDWSSYVCSADLRAERFSSRSYHRDLCALWAAQGVDGGCRRGARRVAAGALSAPWIEGRLDRLGDAGADRHLARGRARPYRTAGEDPRRAARRCARLLGGPAYGGAPRLAAWRRNPRNAPARSARGGARRRTPASSEEHTSELQSLM